VRGSCRVGVWCLVWTVYGSDVVKEDVRLWALAGFSGGGVKFSMGPEVMIRCCSCIRTKAHRS